MNDPRTIPFLNLREVAIPPGFGNGSATFAPGTRASQPAKPKAAPRSRKSAAARNGQPTLAWLSLSANSASPQVNHEHDLYWKGARHAAETLGYHLQWVKPKKGMTAEKLHAQLQADGIQTLILPPTPEAHHLADFPWENYRVIRFDHPISSPPSHHVSCSEVQSMHMAVKRISELGYRRIGFVNGTADATATSKLQNISFTLAQGELELSEQLPVFEMNRGLNGHTQAQLSSWISQYAPDAILTNHPGLETELKNLNIRIPEEIGIAVTNVTEFHPFCGIHRHPIEIGRSCILLIDSLLADESVGIKELVKEVLVRGSWVDGSSMPPKSAAEKSKWSSFID